MQYFVSVNLRPENISLDVTVCQVLGQRNLSYIYHCSKCNTYYLLSCRDNSTLYFFIWRPTVTLYQGRGLQNDHEYIYAMYKSTVVPSSNAIAEILPEILLLQYTKINIEKMTIATS